MVAGRAASIPSSVPEPRVIDATTYLFIAAKSGRRHKIDFSGTGIDGPLLNFFLSLFDEVAGPWAPHARGRQHIITLWR